MRKNPAYGPYILTSDDVGWNKTSDAYKANSLVKFDADSSGVPLRMYLTSKRYGPMFEMSSKTNKTSSI